MIEMRERGKSKITTWRRWLAQTPEAWEAWQRNRPGPESDSSVKTGNKASCRC